MYFEEILQDLRLISLSCCNTPTMPTTKSIVLALPPPLIMPTTLYYIPDASIFPTLLVIESDSEGATAAHNHHGIRSFEPAPSTSENDGIGEKLM